MARPGGGAPSPITLVPGPTVAVCWLVVHEATSPGHAGDIILALSFKAILNLIQGLPVASLEAWT